MFNSHQSEMCANNAWQKYTSKMYFFSFTPIKMKLYTMKVPMKIKQFVLQVSFEINLNMHMSSTLIEYVHRQKHLHMYDKYIGPIFIQSSYCQWEMAMLLLDWPLT